MAKPNEGTDADHGIEEGSYQTSGADGDLQGSEPKQRGGDGSAKANIYAYPQTDFAHKRPVTG